MNLSSGARLDAYQATTRPTTATDGTAPEGHAMRPPFAPTARVNIDSPRHGPLHGTVTHVHPIADGLWRVQVETDDRRGPWLLHVDSTGACTAAGYTIEALP